jgi:hypothetical protein
MRPRVVGADLVLSWAAAKAMIGAGVMLDWLRAAHGQLGWEAAMNGAPSPGPLVVRRHREFIVVSREQVLR